MLASGTELSWCCKSCLQNKQPIPAGTGSISLAALSNAPEKEEVHFQTHQKKKRMRKRKKEKRRKHRRKHKGCSSYTG